MTLEEKIALMQSVGQFSEMWNNDGSSETEAADSNAGSIAFLMSFRASLN